MTNIAMERSTMLLIGTPSISMDHLYHGYVTNNQRVYIYRWDKIIPIINHDYPWFTIIHHYQPSLQI